MVNPNEYLFTFSQPPTGAVQVAWTAAHGITDQAAAVNAFAGGSWSYTLDTSAGEATPYLSEFMASNTRTLADETGLFNDWIELHNPSLVPVNLDGWYLTDSATNLKKWRFPATNLVAGGFLVVFADGTDRRVPGARLHTSFQLSSDGEYLALVKPDGVTVASEFRPVYPVQVPDVSYGIQQIEVSGRLVPTTNVVFFTTPTPGAGNLGGATKPGPIIQNTQHRPSVPLDADDLLVTARVTPALAAVGSVTLKYRIMFNTEVTAPMFDDGAHGDGAAGDGIYGATISSTLSTNGQMIRYAITATDALANTSRWPVYGGTVTNTAEYLGTIVNPTNLTSKLPVFHLFASPVQLAGIDTETGGRVALFLDGELYDNVYMELRGNTSAGYVKKSHRLEFNRNQELRHPGPGGRVRKSALMAEYVDPSYLRQHLCFWFLDQIGVPSPFFYPVRTQMNGAFYALNYHNDVIGQEQMARLGYDPLGALYKAVGNLVTSFDSTGVFQKLEPDNDTSRTDYLELANGIKETSAIGVRRATVFDLLDVPEVINHLAGARWCSENDDVWANMSIYRDTFGDARWRLIPFDMNASWGQLYGGSSPLEATVDTSKSHPLYGGSTTPAGSWNRMYDVIVALPETREMLLRRQRSILDMMVKPPGTPAADLIIENHIKFMTNLISVEANLDRAKWGFAPWAPGKSFSDGVGDILNQFMGPRRQHWYVTHNITNSARPIGITGASNAGIPQSQPPGALVAVVGVEANPSSGDQAQEFVSVGNPAPFAVDISGWKLDGAVNFTFAPGTVVPSNGVVYVSPNLRAFKARQTGPRGGQGLFVVGPYKGQLSARGENLRILNPLGQTLHSFTYPGQPSAAQQYLRITELMFHPSAHPASTNADDFEYLELRNISTNVTLSLAGVRLTNGIDFSFTGSAVTTLAPGARVLVVRNLAAFTARYGSGLPVAGQFVGALDNSGERLQLLDGSNEEVLDFSYNNSWYPLADGLGFSIVIVNENAPSDAWGSKSQWRASGTISGTPGAADPVLTGPAPVLITEALTRSDTPPPTDSIELFNPTPNPAAVGGWWLTDDFNAPKKFKIPAGTVIPAAGYAVFSEADFNPGGTGFALGSDGDEAWLFSADAAGELTGYVHGLHFGAAEDGVSFGRLVTSDGAEHFVAQISRTLGAANAGARVGPIILSEIMYHPPDLATGDNSVDEFIEVQNSSGAPVALFDAQSAATTWRISGGVDFLFPTNLTLAAGEYLLVVNFAPTNTALLNAFRAKYSVDPGVRVVGPYSGQLDNSGGDVELKKPTTPLLAGVPYVLIDKASYRDAAPWPAGADGTGLSLQRRDAAGYGDEPQSWIAAQPSAGGPSPTGGVAPAISAQPQGQTLSPGQSALFSVTAGGTATLRYQWRLNHAAIAGATSSLLQLNNVQAIQAGTYDVLVYNAYGSAVSSNAVLRLLFPPAILLPPQSVQVRVQPDPLAAPSTNASFSVLAFGSGQLSYQWRFNGADLPGATFANLNLTNVGIAQGGDYNVAISDGVSSQVSQAAKLFPLVSPNVVIPPLSQSVLVGAPVTVSVGVTGNPVPFTFEWRRISSPLVTNVVNGTSDFLAFNNTNAVGATVYRLIVKNLATIGAGTVSQFTITTLTDTNSNGLPDVYEALYGIGGVLDPEADNDGDGMKNKQEYGAGTDPTDRLSNLKLEFVGTSPAGATLRFQTATNRTYSVQFSDGLAGPQWRKLTDVLGTTNARLQTVTDPNYTTNRFYRVTVPRQP